ncbi:hypothetical protein O4O02_18480 [Pseudomonas fortuita]|uniref:hypothetical protein n=1 Tax=Pseudomonas fortuita TaxID=3233375 RepID=UPI003D812B34
MTYSMHFQYLAEGSSRPTDSRFSEALIGYPHPPLVPRAGELVDLREVGADGVRTFQVLMVRHQVLQDLDDGSKLYDHQVLVLVGDPTGVDARLLGMKE